jgi:hypothetical protein
MKKAARTVTDDAQVRDEVPMAPCHDIFLDPVARLIEIRTDEIKRRETAYQQRNGSSATLPDFSVLLEDEASQK